MMYNEIWQILIEHAKKNIAYMCIILSNSFEKKCFKREITKIYWLSINLFTFDLVIIWFISYSN